MRYQLTQYGWPVGQWLIPVGTIIDAGNPQTDWDRLAASVVGGPPPNAIALDQECYDKMCLVYDPNRVLSGPDVTR
jgi:hypothetical protein